MEFKGTKGKWEVKNQNIEKKWFNISSDKDIIARTFYGDAEPIVNDQEGHANALLISKAPKMLEMLKQIIEQANEVVYVNSMGASETYFQLINKAEQLIKEATEI